MLNDFKYEKHVKFYTVKSLKVLDRVSSYQVIKVILKLPCVGKDNLEFLILLLPS